MQAQVSQTLSQKPMVCSDEELKWTGENSSYVSFLECRSSSLPKVQILTTTKKHLPENHQCCHVGAHKSSQELILHCLLPWCFQLTEQQVEWPQHSTLPVHLQCKKMINNMISQEHRMAWTHKIRCIDKFAKNMHWQNFTSKNWLELSTTKFSTNSNAIHCSL